MKNTPTDGTRLAAHLLDEVIRKYERNPALRRQLGISLKSLAEVATVRRQLLKQRKK
jgi:hypothetical protein